METLFSTTTARAIQWLLAILIIDYACVTAAAIIDLRSGVSKCRRLGLRPSSGGYRRTVDKLGRYYITLMALTVIDIMIVISALMLQATAGWTIPAFPLFTTLGAIALTLIEAKSVMENTQHKADYTSTARAVNDMLSDPEIKEFVSRLRQLLKKQNPS